VAGKIVFDIIDRVPLIKLDEPGKKEVKTLNGLIEFKNVTFAYPSRKEQNVL